MGTPSQIKQQSFVIKNFLSDAGVSIKLSLAQELAAKLTGHQDLNTALAVAPKRPFLWKWDDGHGALSGAKVLHVYEVGVPGPLCTVTIAKGGYPDNREACEANAELLVTALTSYQHFCTSVPEGVCMAPRMTGPCCWGWSHFRGDDEHMTKDQCDADYGWIEVSRVALEDAIEDEGYYPLSLNSICYVYAPGDKLLSSHSKVIEECVRSARGISAALNHYESSLSTLKRICKACKQEIAGIDRCGCPDNGVIGTFRPGNLHSKPSTSTQKNSLGAAMNTSTMTVYGKIADKQFVFSQRIMVTAASGLIASESELSKYIGQNLPEVDWLDEVEAKEVYEFLHENASIKFKDRGLDDAYPTYTERFSAKHAWYLSGIWDYLAQGSHNYVRGLFESLMDGEEGDIQELAQKYVEANKVVAEPLPPLKSA